MSSQQSQLIATLKQQLRSKGLTYRQLGVALDLSEARVKKMFASERFTLDRVIEIAEMLGLTLSELTRLAEQQQAAIHTLTEQQEAELTADTRLLLVCVCVLNHWSMDEITRTYQLDSHTCLLCLLRLDKLGLIQVLPGNRIRLNIARDFDWRSDGPIRRFFIQHGLSDFLNDDFVREDESLCFTHGMLSRAAMHQMQAEIRRLRQRFAELHSDSMSLPLTHRHGTAMIVAMREWELQAFEKLRRN